MIGSDGTTIQAIHAKTYCYLHSHMLERIPESESQVLFKVVWELCNTCQHVED